MRKTRDAPVGHHPGRRVAPRDGGRHRRPGDRHRARPPPRLVPAPGARVPTRRRQAPGACHAARAAPAPTGTARRRPGAPRAAPGRVRPRPAGPHARRGQAERLERELADLARRVEGHHGSLGRDFDRVVDVLRRRGLRGHRPRPTSGRSPHPATMLANIFHECDLLVAECLRLGQLDGVGGAGARRPAVDVRVRAPQPRPAGAAVVAERSRPTAVAARRRDQRGPRRRRAGRRAGAAPSARRRLLRRRPRLDGGPRPRHGRRRRRVDRAATSCAR